MVTMNEMTCVQTTNVIGWKHIATYHFSEELSLRVNCKIIFGEDLGELKLLRCNSQPNANSYSEQSRLFSGCTQVPPASAGRYAHFPLSASLD